MTTYFAIKALHVIFMVSWFSAIFFLGRILIYHSEALTNEKNKDIMVPFFTKSERNIIWIILIPSMLLTAVFGTVLMMQTKAYLQGWFHIKLAMLFVYFGYNFYLLKLRRDIRLEREHPKGFKLRLLNEVPFFFLVSIVFTVYQKSFFSGVYAALIVLGVVVFIGFFVRGVKRLKQARHQIKSGARTSLESDQ